MPHLLLKLKLSSVETFWLVAAAGRRAAAGPARPVRRLNSMLARSWISVIESVSWIKILSFVPQERRNGEKNKRK